VVSGFAPSSVTSTAYTIMDSGRHTHLLAGHRIYSSVQTVAITDLTPGAKIYFTTNGTAPTTSSTLYAGPLPSLPQRRWRLSPQPAALCKARQAPPFTLSTWPPTDALRAAAVALTTSQASSGTLLPTYNSKWTLAGGTNSIYTTGSESAEISGSASAVYYYAASTSDTAQITLLPPAPQLATKNWRA